MAEGENEEVTIQGGWNPDSGAEEESPLQGGWNQDAGAGAEDDEHELGGLGLGGGAGSPGGTPIRQTSPGVPPGREGAPRDRGGDSGPGPGPGPPEVVEAPRSPGQQRSEGTGNGDPRREKTGDRGPGAAVPTTTTSGDQNLGQKPSRPKDFFKTPGKGKEQMEFGWNELLDKDVSEFTEISAKKLPSYLRRSRGSGSTGADRGMKSKLLDCPLTTLRKPTAIMETELPLMRQNLIAEGAQKKTDTRVLRRLRRKCRVRDHEDLDDLAEAYANHQEEALPDPAEEILYTKPRAQARDFFAELREKRPFHMQKPADVAPNLPHSLRFSGHWIDPSERNQLRLGSGASSSQS